MNDRRAGGSAANWMNDRRACGSTTNWMNYGRVGGFAADASIVIGSVLAPDDLAANYHRVGGEAANPTDIPRDIAATTLKNQPTLFAADG